MTRTAEVLSQNGVSADANVKVVVDGHSLGWRAFYACEGLSHDGIPTGMAYGFLRTLRDILAATRATHCLVALDGGSPAFRTALLPTYKQREPIADPEEAIQKANQRAEFISQMHRIEVLLPKLGGSSLHVRGWEADDIIGSWAKVLGPNDYMIIVSGDRDLYQLITRRVWYWTLNRNLLGPKKAEEMTMARRLLTPLNFEEVTGVPSPAHWFRFRVLTGDGSDGIPGVPGIGDKRALEIVKTGWPTQSDGGRWAEKLREHNAIVQRNIQLMLLQNRQREFRYDDARFTVPKKDLPDARRLLEQMGMHSLTAAWADWSEPFDRLL